MKNLKILKDEYLKKSYMCEEVFDKDLEEGGHQIINHIIQHKLHSLISKLDNKLPISFVKELVLKYVDTLKERKQDFICDFNCEGEDYYCSLSDIKDIKIIEDEVNVDIEYILIVDIFKVVSEVKNNQRVS